MPDVSYVRNELSKMVPRYDIIRDCIEQLVKEKGLAYLPKPNADDTSSENTKRYDAYLLRSVFYNVTGRTASGMTGQVFSRNPVIELPEQLKIVEKDANGSGVDLTQEAKEAVKYTLAYGRAGLFIDYPKVQDAATVAQLQSGEIRPTINLYKPECIINWRTLKRGARHILSLVVLSETWTKEDDGFKSTQEQQYRVLRLDAAGLYRVEVWREAAENQTTPAATPVSASNIDAPKDSFVEFEFFEPTDAAGTRLDEIPFTFIGAVNNDPEIDAPPLYDLAMLNIAHYRNSADYEEACFIVGQPTPWFAGLTKQWVDDVLKNKIPLGARAAVPLPVDASAGLLQVEPNTMPKEAMEHKERQMVALGAKLVEQRETQRTATEAGLDSASETSILSSSSKNVSLAFKFALEWCAVFVGIGEEGIKFELNTEFDLASMSAEQRTQTIAEWQAGAIAFDEMRAALRKAGVATMDDKEAKAAIDKEMASSLAFASNPGSGTQDRIRDEERRAAQQDRRKPPA